MSPGASTRRAIVLCPSGNGILARRISAAGYKTQLLVDAETLAVRLAAQEPFDLVVADSVTDGFDLRSLSRLVRDRASGATGLVAVTDEAESSVASALAAGVDEAVPVDASDVLLDARLDAALRSVDLRRSAARLAHEARIDPVTGLANRRALDEELARVAGRMRRFGERWCLVLVDLDRFKDFNDARGHAAGDQLLRQFGKLLVANIRIVDLAFRYGGDEFLLLLSVSADRTPHHATRRLRRAVADAEIPHPANDPWGRVTMSAGFAVRGGEAGVAGWIESADQALYEAKRQGRNRVIGASAVGAARVG